MNHPPDFVLVGAPKCGTTSLYSTLRRHPQLFLPGIKEPHFFALDYPKRREVRTARSYDRLFAPAQSTQLRGEASVHYLSSERAIPAILERSPEAKLIAAVRNPVDVFISLHNEFLKNLDEDEEDPEKAWHLQSARLGGAHIPKLCKVPQLLQYHQVCLFGEQIKRMFALVPPARRHVIVFDDLQEDAGAVVATTLRFLGVKDVQLGEFARENSYAQVRSQFVARLLRSSITNEWLRRIRLGMKLTFRHQEKWPAATLRQRNLKSMPKPVLTKTFSAELDAAFEADVGLLGSLIGRDLSMWHQRNARASRA